MLSNITKYCNSSNIVYSKGVQATIFYYGQTQFSTLLSRDINPIVIELIHDIDSLLEKIETSDSKLEGLNTMIHQLY